LHYRVYKLNSAGRIVSGEWIEAESEPEARRLAQAMCGEGTPSVELWQGAQKLAVLPCEGDTPPRRLTPQSPPPARDGR
jgi:hypothetical protein